MPWGDRFISLRHMLQSKALAPAALWSREMAARRGADLIAGYGRASPAPDPHDAVQELMLVGLPHTGPKLPSGEGGEYTVASNALAAGEAPSWVAAMLGHMSPEMLFSVYARYIPNRTRRDGSALMSRGKGTSH